MDIFLKFHSQQNNLSEESALILKAEFEVVEVPRKQVIVSEGAMCNHIYFVESGLTRSYFITEGRESTMGFSVEGEIAIMTYEWQRTSPLSIVAIEDTVLLKISQTRFEELLSESIQLAYWAYKIMKYTVSNMMRELMVDSSINGEEKYKLLLYKYPEFLQRIPLKDLASWFNITPSSLSRIRSKIK